MEAMNCPRCGKIFVQVFESICDSCIKAEEHIFDKVREYVKDNPNRTVKEVSDACEVSVKRVLQYIRDGRIEASSGMHGEIVCSKCAKPILIGRMCEKCILETNFEVQDMKDAAKLRGKIHTKRR